MPDAGKVATAGLSCECEVYLLANQREKGGIQKAAIFHLGQSEIWHFFGLFLFCASYSAVLYESIMVRKQIGSHTFLAHRAAVFARSSEIPRGDIHVFP